ncbi:unnamed protein product [Rotaria sordida]|uniref:G-protein coupled receptors family 1 profile domain-containing protein n=1 Tax=Rotaria sordida TaxID=392033 RepID=A0A815JT58_9BILA|nr:unnamed protein product [Rotaria sordida]CAF1383146.1 unnamed protein product [Rotaria sordida]CAF4265471.1 unnamed protein product [Rotaria sordida]
MSVLKAAIQLAFWGPIVLFIIGVPSAILNAIIFIGLKTFRQSSSSYYIVSQSLFDFGALLILLLQSIPSTSASVSSISCKILTYRNIHLITVINAQQQSVRTRLSM